MRALRTSLWAAVLVLPALAAAHTMGGVSKIKLGGDFSFLAMKAVLPGEAGHHTLGAIDFTPLRGHALAFLVIDPGLPADLAQAKRFEQAARKLSSTRAFLVALPQRSFKKEKLLEQADQAGFGLPLIADDRGVFPFSFGFPISQSPRYELFDHSWTLVVANAARIDQQMPTGFTVLRALRELDQGHPVEPAEFSTQEDLLLPKR